MEEFKEETKEETKDIQIKVDLGEDIGTLEDKTITHVMSLPEEQQEIITDMAERMKNMFLTAYSEDKVFSDSDLVEIFLRSIALLVYRLDSLKWKELEDKKEEERLEDESSL